MRWFDRWFDAKGPGLTLVLLSALVMLAFAGNSILTRLALANGHIDPASFAAIRVAAGVVALVAMLRASQRISLDDAKPTWPGALALTLYLIGFSWAYVSLDAGLGALILFAVVQLTMFGWALWSKQTVPHTRWAGMTLAMMGLAILLWPNSEWQLSWLAVLAMIAAAVAWGAYSLIGARSTQPLLSTTINFLYAAPIVVALALVSPGERTITGTGVVLAIAAGAITSGLGYALWYVVLPRLGATQAAISQLSVPIIATVIGVLALGERVDMRFLIATALVLVGILIGSYSKHRPEKRPPDR